jgi:hypothetical protein
VFHQIIYNFRVVVDVGKDLLWLVSHQYLEEFAEVARQDGVQLFVGVDKGEQFLEQLKLVVSLLLVVKQSGSSGNGQFTF